jgi:hypothetical protein
MRGRTNNSLGWPHPDDTQFKVADMSDTASVVKRSPIAPLVSSQATRARLQPQRKRENRRALIAGCCILLLTGIGAAVLIATEISKSAQSTKLSQATGPAPGAEAHAAKITNALGSDCFQQEFDNRTGRMTRLQEPCETIARDSNGAPIPVGTIHRLDAISKGFSGR